MWGQFRNGAARAGARGAGADRVGAKSDWARFRSGGSGRALLLLALAGVLRWVDLPVGQLAPMAWLMIVFV